MAFVVLFTVTGARFASLKVCCKTSQRVKFRECMYRLLSAYSLFLISGILHIAVSSSVARQLVSLLSIIVRTPCIIQPSMACYFFLFSRRWLSIVQRPSVFEVVRSANSSCSRRLHVFGVHCAIRSVVNITTTPASRLSNHFLQRTVCSLVCP